MAMRITGSGILCSVGNVGTPPSFVQANSSSGVAVSSLTCTFTSAQLVNDTNVLAISCSVAGAISSVADSSGNSYTLVPGASQTNGLFNLYVYATCTPVTSSTPPTNKPIVPASASANTVTVNFSTPVTASLQIYEASGVGGVDGNILATTGTTVNSTGTLNLQYQTAITLCVAIGDATTPPTAGAGFTARTTGTATGLAFILEDAPQAISTSSATSIAVTCPATGVATTVWTTVAISLYQVGIAPPRPDISLCFFINPTNVASNNCVMINVTGGYIFEVSTSVGLSSSGWSLTLNSNSANFGELPIAGNWYFIGIALRASGSSIAYSKKVGAPVSAATVITNSLQAYAPTQVVIGGQANFQVNNSSSSYGDQGLGIGAIAGLRIWSGQVLTQAEMERESEALTPARTAGLWMNLPMTTAGDVTDETKGLLQFRKAGGTFKTSIGPPVPYNRPRRIQRRKSSVKGIVVSTGILTANGGANEINVVAGELEANGGAHPLVVTGGILTRT